MPSARRFASPFALVLIPLAVSLSSAADVGATGESTLPARPHHRVPLSAAYERMLRDEIAAGRVLRPEIIKRFGLDLPESEPSFEGAPVDQLHRRESFPGAFPAGPGVALRPDTEANDKSGDVTCSTGCGNRPLGQAETTIAALGSFLLAGWNNTKGFCTGGAIQGYAYSVDAGATWVDAGDPPALPSGGRYRGDPVHTVNRSTGDFYILGIYDSSSLGPMSGLALARGHFSGGAFVIDDNRQIAVGGANFLDKEWMAVDPATGYLYVTYSNFVGGTTSQIELIRSTTNGATWDPPVVLNSPATNDLVQGSRPAVGPGGEVYVVWYEFGAPLSHMRIRRSDNFGVSFGAEQTVCDFYENVFSGAPGFRRGFGIALPGIAVDNSAGPYRGRAYVTWDEAVNFYDAPFSMATAKSEVENNGFFANATPFTVGNVLRGALASSVEIDLWKFSGSRGQTLYFKTDSATISTAMNMRLVCASDTSTLNNYRFLAFSQDALPSLVFTLPADGTYYLRLSSATSTPPQYRIQTTFDTPSLGERARDHRDNFIAHSDGGTAWSTPLRLTNSAPWYDNEFPEVTVDGTGAVHCFWHDFRDDAACGAESYEYLVSSGDGGASLGPNRRLSDARSFWSINACGSANQGDYQGITSEGNTVYPCWADSRLGDPDVWAEGDLFRHGSGCPPDQTAPAGSSPTLSFTVNNTGNTDGTFGYGLSDGNGWLTASSGSASVGAGGTQTVQASLNVPANCSPQSDTVRFVTSDSNIPGRRDTCETVVFCVSATGVPGGPKATLFLAPPAPNPSPRGARLRFGLSHQGTARLEIFAANGARLRTLVSGRQDAGEHAVLWDGRDQRGYRMRAGVYYALLEAEGRSLRRPLVIVP